MGKYTILGGGFKYFLFSPLFGKDSHFDQYFSDGLKPPTRLSVWYVQRLNSIHSDHRHSRLLTLPCRCCRRPRPRGRKGKVTAPEILGLHTIQRHLPEKPFKTCQNKLCKNGKLPAKTVGARGFEDDAVLRRCILFPFLFGLAPKELGGGGLWKRLL